MNLLALWDPSRCKQAVASACSLNRKEGQNLNIYLMQCETKIPVVVVFLFWGLFIAVACAFLGVVYQNQTRLTGEASLGLKFSPASASCSTYVCVRVSQYDTMPGVKYHLLLESPAHSGNHQVNSLGLPADLQGCLWCLLSWSSLTNRRPTDWLTGRLLTVLLD